MNNDTKVLHAYIQRKIRILTQSRNESWVKATLATLRRGVGEAPGALPEVWPITLGDMPQTLVGQGATPSKAEWAAHTTLTLFALHQQGKNPRTECMSRDNATFGSAVRRLSPNQEISETVKRRFDAAVTADSPEEFAHHLRGLVQLMRQAGIPLDYPALGEQLYWFQYPERRDAVRLEWGRAFYHGKTEDALTDANKDGETREEAENHE